MGTGEVKRDPEGNYKHKLIESITRAERKYFSRKGISLDNKEKAIEEAVSKAKEEISERGDHQEKTPVERKVFREAQHPQTQQMIKNISNVSNVVKPHFGGGEATPPTA